MRVCFIVTGLELGGAELSMLKVIDSLNGRVEASVVSLSGNGPVGQKLIERGIPLQVLNSTGARIGMAFELGRLSRAIRQENPDIIQTWMYHADLVGGLVAKRSRVPVVWNIRNGLLDWRKSRISTITVRRLCSLLSRRIPKRIVSCAESARKIHVALGYPNDKFKIIPNGVDTEYFKYNRRGAAGFRERCELGENDRVVGFVGRFDPQKDYETFLKAASVLTSKREDVRYVLLGPGNEKDNKVLVSLINKYSLWNKIRLRGGCSDMAAALSAFDVLAMTSSYGEAFPNVVAEAMACEVPAVVTDVGDAAQIVSTPDHVCKPGDYRCLAAAWEKLLGLNARQRRDIGKQCRQKIVETYEMSRTAESYLSLYEEVLNGTCAG